MVLQKIRISLDSKKLATFLHFIRKLCPYHPKFSLGESKSHKGTSFDQYFHQEQCLFEGKKVSHGTHVSFQICPLPNLPIFAIS